MHSATCSGVRSMLTPAAWSTSALPEWLVPERLPCFAIRTPAPAAMRAAVVEMLKVPDTSPPVPAVSTSPSGSTGTLAARPRMTRAAAAISSTVSPFMRSPMRNPPICDSVASPVMIVRMTAVIEAPSRSRPSATVRMAVCMSIADWSSRAPFRGRPPFRPRIRPRIRPRPSPLPGPLRPRPASPRS